MYLFTIALFIYLIIFFAVRLLKWAISLVLFYLLKGHAALDKYNIIGPRFFKKKKKSIVNS